MASRQQACGLTSSLSVCFLIFPTTALGRDCVKTRKELASKKIDLSE